jgi:hypothetical protein
MQPARLHFLYSNHKNKNMKTYKLNSIVPVLAILFALTAAFANNATIQSKDARLILVQGYIRSNGLCIPGTPLCSNIAGNICTTSNGTQMWGINAQGQCVLEIYKAPQ